MSRPVRTALEAARYLDGLINREHSDRVRRRVDLAPIRALLDMLGHPEAGLSILHIAGSKGKGSTALAAEALLRAAGRSVGVFTSPHLERWTERFRVGGEEVPGAELARAVERLRPHVDALLAGPSREVPSFFDATTATALLLFRERGVDHAVLEVGLGGRLDSTNAIQPAVTCITGIELEHTDKLGSTLGAIATEKAGILKRHVPLLCGRLVPEAEAAVAAQVARLEVPWLRLGREIAMEHSQGRGGSRLRVEDGDLCFEGPLAPPGRHQAENAALALACVRRLAPEVSGAELARAAREALPALRLPGRTEILSRQPAILIDSAHTVASARALREVITLLPRRRMHLVLSISADKDLGALLPILLADASSVTVTRAEPRRSLEPSALAVASATVAPELPLRVIPNPHLALRAARATLEDPDLLVVAGSFYLAGIARRVLGSGASSGDPRLPRGGAPAGTRADPPGV
ncbi:MAG: Mur ligase family protein [Myxococcota bacterium]